MAQRKVVIAAIGTKNEKSKNVFFCFADESVEEYHSRIVLAFLSTKLHLSYYAEVMDELWIDEKNKGNVKELLDKKLNLIGYTSTCWRDANKEIIYSLYCCWRPANNSMVNEQLFC